MRDHEPTQTTRPPVRVRRVAVIRADGSRFSIHATTTSQEVQLEPLTAPTLGLNDLADRRRQVVASTTTHAETQQGMKRLAAASFPVQYSEIASRDLRLVERVTGRTTLGAQRLPAPTRRR